ncbi:MAG: cupin domain-containing protein [Gammaproteobacteria bacterium]
MSKLPFVSRPGQRPRPLDVVGEELSVLVAKDATQGYEVFLQVGVEGSGPPPHSHDWDESFYVISGQMEFGYGKESHSVAPGGFVHIPGGTVHWFRFLEAGGQMISITSAGNAAKFFTAVDEEVTGADPDFGKLAAVAEAHGLTIEAG